MKKKPNGYRVATMQDYQDRKIVLGTIYYLNNSEQQFKIRGRLIAGQRVGNVTIQQTESEEHYENNYRSVILHYIKSGILWIKE